MGVNSRDWRAKGIRANLGVISMHVAAESTQEKRGSRKNPEEYQHVTGE